MGFIVALEQALYIYNADYAIFFEDDARPFKSIKKMLGPTFTYGQYTYAYVHAYRLCAWLLR